MEDLNVYWEEPPQMPEQDGDTSDSMGGAGAEVHLGFLTTNPEYSPDGTPVLVEETTNRVYTPGELPSETQLFVETAPGEPPAIATVARRAGFHVLRADTQQPL